MAKVFLWVSVVMILAVPAVHGAVGQAGQGDLHARWGQADPETVETIGARIGQTSDVGWANADQVRASMANQNALGASVGMPTSIQEKLTQRETIGAGVGLSDQLRERLMAQNALGLSAQMPSPIQERLMNRQTVAAGVGIPSTLRERLMGTQTTE